MKKETPPQTYEEAIAQGYRICEESMSGESSQPGGLRRQGVITLEKLHRKSGDVEKLELPYTATFTIGRVSKYKVNRHSYLTPAEAAEFTASVNPVPVPRWVKERLAETAKAGQ
jgi:hypothetical protein